MASGYGTSNGQKFSTKDQDNTGCSKRYHGAWWYKGCHFSNLNGHFSATKINDDASYMSWFHMHNSYQSMKTSFMMMRPANFKP